MSRVTSSTHNPLESKGYSLIPEHSPSNADYVPKSDLLHAIRAGFSTTIDIGKVQALKVISSLSLPVPPDLQTASAEHFASEEIDYMLIPCKIKSVEECRIAPFGLLLKSSCILTERRCIDASETVAYNVCNGTELSEIEVTSFIQQYQHIYPGMTNILDGIKATNDKLATLTQTMAQHNSTIAYNQAAQASHLSYLAQQNSTHNDETSKRISNLETMLSALKTSIEERMRPITFSDQPSVKYDLTEDHFEVPSINNPDNPIAVTDSVEQITTTSLNKRITLTQQHTTITNSEGTFVLPKPIESDHPPVYTRSFSDVIKEDKRIDRLRSQQNKIVIKTNLESILPKNGVEFLDQACCKPKEISKYCSTDSWTNSADLHVSKFFFDSNTLKKHEGCLCYTIYINGCTNPLPVYLVAKDDRGRPSYQGGNGIACDIVTPRRLALFLGFKEINTEYVLIPFLRKTKDKSFLPGMYAGRLGSLQRRWITKYSSSVYNSIADTSLRMVKSNATITDIIDYILNSLLLAFEDLDFGKMVEIDNLPGFSKLYSHISGNVTLASIPKSVSHLAKALPAEMLPKLSTCLVACNALKDERNGLMYGSYVVYNPTVSAYETPCGALAHDLTDYWKHPCTVRARTIAIQPHNFNDQHNDRLSNLRFGYPCSTCGRRYIDKFDCITCSIFCALVPHGVSIVDYLNEKFIIKPNPNPVSAFGERIQQPTFPPSKFSLD